MFEMYNPCTNPRFVRDVKVYNPRFVIKMLECMGHLSGICMGCMGSLGSLKCEQGYPFFKNVLLQISELS